MINAVKNKAYACSFPTQHIYPFMTLPSMHKINYQLKSKSQNKEHLRNILSQISRKNK